MKKAITTSNGLRFGQLVRSDVTGQVGIIMEISRHLAGCEFVKTLVKYGEDKESDQLNTFDAKRVTVIDEARVEEFEKIFVDKCKNTELKCGYEFRDVLNERNGYALEVSYSWSGEAYINLFIIDHKDKSKPRTDLFSVNELTFIGEGVSGEVQEQIEKRKAGTLEEIEVGDKVRTLIGDFEGTVTMKSQMLNGSKNFYILPLCDKYNKQPEGRWADWELCELVEKAASAPEPEKTSTGCIGGYCGAPMLTGGY